jgi:hypothetical protein
VLEKIKKDNFLFGFVMGLLIPLLVFIAVYAIDAYLADLKQVKTVIKDSTKYIIGVFINLILFRLYMVNWKMDETGKGLLAMTFILAMVYVVLFEFLKIKYLFP